MFSIACRRDDTPRQIFQQINFYIQDENGKDLLNPNVGMTYYGNTTFLDLNDERADVPIHSITYDKDITSTYFIKYLTGAKRIFARRSRNSEIYVSDFIIRRSDINEESKTIDSDTIHVVYSLKPSIFEVQEVCIANSNVCGTVRGIDNAIKVTIKH